MNAQRECSSGLVTSSCVKKAVTHVGPPQAHIVVPMHKQLKVGTLGDILKSVAEQRGLTLETLLGLL